MEINDFALIPFTAMIEYRYIGSIRAWVETFQDNLDVMFELFSPAEKYFPGGYKRTKMRSTGTEQCSRSESVIICTDPDLDPDPDPSINKQKISENP